MTGLLYDIRYGIRTLSRNPGFACIAILTFALGIGANSAIFTVVNTVLLKPLPFKDPDRLMMIWERNSAIGKDRDPVAPPNFEDWRKIDTGFAELAAYRYGSFALTGVDDPEQVATLAITANTFPTLGAQPMLGRTFTADEVERKDRVVILSHEFWQRRFMGDRSIVGRAITLSDAPYVVVGVMSSDFRFPMNDDNIDAWAPLIFNVGDMTGRRSHSLTVIGRLRADVTPGLATKQLGDVARRIAAMDPTSNPEITIIPAQESLVGKFRSGLMVLFGTVGLVLLIACANVANLLLARATSRAREISVRASLGATRSRLVRQLLTENLILALAGGFVGILIASWTLYFIVQFTPADLPRLAEITVDSTVLAFTTILSVAAGTLFGIVPALTTGRFDLMEAIKDGGRSGQSRGKGRARAALVATEIALSLTLLAGAGLMIRSFVNMLALDYGFRPKQILTMQVFLPANKYPIDNSQFRPTTSLPSANAALAKPAAYFVSAIDRIKAIPGVESAAAVSKLPLNQVAIDFDFPVVIEGRPKDLPGQEPQADFRIATEDYFRTMGIPVVRGRSFSAFDGPGSGSVLIINEVFASQLFPNQNPLGQRVVLYGRPREIIGVVGSVRYYSYNRMPRPEMYVPARQFMFSGMTIAVKTSTSDPATLAATIKSEIHKVDPEQPVYRIRTMDQFVSETVAGPRFTTLLLGIFAGLAIVLAVVGVYGVISYMVAQRSHEIGVRIALGAGRYQVIEMILRQAMRMTVIGLAAGLLGAFALTRFMASLVFGVSVTDPFTLVVVTLLLVAVALLAAYVPARRATRIDAISALRIE
jgi:putative ABC transport system permease protein